MWKRSLALAAWTLVLVAAAMLLVGATPALLLQAGRGDPSPDAAVAIAAAAAAWLILGWICLGLALSLVEIGTEVAGRRIWSPVSRAAHGMTPPGLHTAIRASLRLGLVASSAGAVLVAAPGAVHAESGNSERWPSVDRLVVDRSAVDSSAAHRAAADHRAVPQRSGARPTVAYRVHPGDTLWDIAAAHLPPGSSAAAIAARWPRWWSANRQIIGPDPNLLRPGQRLQPPTDRSAGAA